MQKIIFYQEVQPKAADALWLHHGYDSNGNKKESISIDYIQNGVVRHIMDAGEGSGSTSDGYKPYLKLTPSAEFQTAGPGGLTFTSAAEAAQSLGISEQDFLKCCSAQMPTNAGLTDEAFLVLNEYREDYEEAGLGHVISWTEYRGFDFTANEAEYRVYIVAFNDGSETDDSVQQYNVRIAKFNGIG